MVIKVKAETAPGHENEAIGSTEMPRTPYETPSCQTRYPVDCQT
jgi:hypothetical protein